jgi:hypothetical protein
MPSRIDLLPVFRVGRHRNAAAGRSLGLSGRAEILILTARINFNP